MAPEQWRGQLQDAATDQYALGVVIYELLAGRLPFEAVDDNVLRYCVLEEAVTPIDGQADHVNQALLRALAKERSARFENCSQLIAALAAPVVADVVPAAVVNDPPVAPPGPSPDESFLRRTTERAAFEGSSALPAPKPVKSFRATEHTFADVSPAVLGFIAFGMFAVDRAMYAVDMNAAGEVSLYDTPLGLVWDVAGHGAMYLGLLTMALSVFRVASGGKDKTPRESYPG